MSSSHLAQPGLITLHHKIALAIAVLLAGIVAFSRNHDAEAAENSGGYSRPPAVTQSAQPDSVSAIGVRLSEWKLDVSQQTVPTGEVRFTVTNGGTMLHAFVLEGQGLEKELQPLNVGATAAFQIPLQPGTYELYCPIGDGAHKKLGMVARLEVLKAGDGHEARS
jgi:Cupredoxin-like domain